jgi:hypothetical protein
LLIVAGDDETRFGGTVDEFLQSSLKIRKLLDMVVNASKREAGMGHL